VTAKRHSDLIAWQKAMNLVETVYQITKGFPKEETYGLTSQLRRAAVSVPSNIAEGHSRTGGREFIHGLSIAHGSLSEVETQVEIARRLGYITESQQLSISRIASETGRLINGLLNSLEKHVAAR
jgi:four helix bundle protein